MVLFRKKIARTWKLSANTMVSKLLTFASTIGESINHTITATISLAPSVGTLPTIDAELYGVVLMCRHALHHTIWNINNTPKGRPKESPGCSTGS